MKFTKHKTQNTKHKTQNTKPKTQIPILLLIFTSFLISTTMAQNQYPQAELLGGINPALGQVFEQGYGGAYDERFLGMCSTSFGLAQCGWQENSSGKKLGWVVLIDSIGEPIAQYSYTKNADFILQSIQSDGGNGYIVTGRIDPNYSSYHQVGDNDTAFAARIDSVGQIVWEHKFKLTGEGEVGMYLTQVEDDKFWVLTNLLNDQGYQQSRIREIETDGTVHTTKTHGSSTGTLFSYKLIRSSDELILLGNDLDNTHEPILYQLDEEGGEIDNYSFGQGNDCQVYGISPTETGGFLLAGQVEVNSDTGAIVIEVDSTFTQGFVYERNETGKEYFTDVVADSTGAIAVGGCNNLGEGGEDGLVVHLDNYGDSIMVETLGRTDDDALLAAIQAPLGSGGGVFASGFSQGGAGNGYLIKSIKYGEIPCPLPRFLWVDNFITIDKVNGGVLDSITVLGDLSAEDSLIQFAKTNKINMFVTSGANYLFESSYANANRNGHPYDSLFNQFLAKARRNGITCAFPSTVDTGLTAYHGAGFYNLTDSIIKHNYSMWGKIHYFQLEHEFWNTKYLVALSGPQAGRDGISLTGTPRNEHFIGCYNDHKAILDTLNLQKFKDANIMAVYDYIDRLYNNWANTANLYGESNDSARSARAKELEKKSNAIFLTHYKTYWPVHNGTDFLITNTSDTTDVIRFNKRLSFFGQDTNRKTYLFPTFSGEWYNRNDTTDTCGDAASVEHQYLGSFFRDTNSQVLNKHLNHVEDTFLNQWGIFVGDTNFPYLTNVQVSCFGWFKYTCLDSNSYSVTSLNDCPVYVQSISTKGNETSTNIEDSNYLNIQVYPNPTTAILNIKGVESSSKMRVVTSNGTTIYQSELKEENSTLDLTNWPIGVYIMRIESEGRVFNFKVVRQ